MIIGWKGIYNNVLVEQHGEVKDKFVYYSYSYIVDGFRQFGFHIDIVLFKKNKDMMAAFSKLDGIAQSSRMFYTKKSNKNSAVTTDISNSTPDNVQNRIKLIEDTEKLLNK